jgi:hypothetical protein
MFQSESTKGRIFNQNIQFIHLANIQDKWDLGRVNEAIDYLTNEKISKFLQPNIREQVCTDLKSLMGKVIVQIDSDSKLIAIFNRKAMILIKTFEATVLPKELSQSPCFHGNELLQCMELIKGLNEIKKRSIDFKRFAYVYCEFAFSFIDRLCNQSLFLIRPCTSIPSGEHAGRLCKLFTITSRAKGVFAVGEIQHNLIAISVNGVGQEKWSRAYLDNERVILDVEEFETLRALTQQMMPEYAEAPKLKGEVLNSFSQRYYRSISTYNTKSATKLFEGDFILRALQDPISHAPMTWSCVNMQGNTYSRDGILQWLLKNSTDPMTREPCEKHLLRPNILVDILIDTRKRMLTAKESPTLDPFLAQFRDPLNPKQLIKDPVIATNNVTYDRATITEYLNESSNKLPGGKPCTPEELINNRVVKEALELYLAKLAENK